MFLSTDYKQRISSNPNGLAWSNDETKFGQKMLEKMGWKKGKGLGANEDGIIDHVKVSMKGDKKGIGCTQTHTDKWLDRLDEYEAILAQLNQSSNSKTEDKEKRENAVFESLNKKSKSVRNRVHYSKFTKGKDLSLKSETDVDCIFGGKRERQKKNTKVGEPSEVNSAESTEGKQFGVITTTSSTNLQDYFAQKMASLRRAKSDTQLSEMCKEADVSQPESFESSPAAVCFDDNEHVMVKPSKKKKKRAEVSESSKKLVNDCILNTDVESKLSDVHVDKIKMKKQKADDMVTSDSSKIMLMESLKKAKKKKDKCSQDNSYTDDICNDDSSAVQDSVDSIRSKKRKRRAEVEKTEKDLDKVNVGLKKKKKKRTKL